MRVSELPSVSAFPNLVERKHLLRDFLTEHPVLYDLAPSVAEGGLLDPLSFHQSDPWWVIEDFIVSGMKDIFTIYITLHGMLDAIETVLGKPCPHRELISQLKIIGEPSKAIRFGDRGGRLEWVFNTPKTVEMGYKHPYRAPYPQGRNFVYHVYRQAWANTLRLDDLESPVQVKRKHRRILTSLEVVGDTGELISSAEAFISSLLSQEVKVVGSRLL